MQTTSLSDTRKIWPALTVFLLVFAACLLGIVSRPVGFLAVFWPVNAVLLAVLVRCPQWATRAGWGMAVLGYLAADLLTGSSLQKALLLNAANLTGVVVGYLLFMRLSPPARMLQRGASSMYLFGICLAAAAATGVVGAGVSQWLFGRPYLTSLALWFSSEFTNYVTLMPFILVFPADWRYRLRVACAMLTQRSQWPQAGRKMAVLALLALAAVCSVLIGGPGAVIFPMPVLLWLAMSFSLFSTMIAVLVYVLWCHLAIDFGLLSTTLDMKVLQNTVSMRLGIALLALGPIAVASMNYARNALLRTLEHVASHDALTHVLTRNAFMQRGERVIDQKGELVCVMMLDIDYFKSINDRFGHAGGDQALMAFTRAIAADLSVDDLFGRMGGEEFAIVSTLGQPQQGVQLAERLRQRIEAESITMPAGHPLQITVSIGMVTCPGGSGHSLADLLKLADLAVYKAKNAGRNRVATPESCPPNDPDR
ncbi:MULTISPECIES: GGDEF domain-containing protein [Serratia]|uniref:diguanylate cyclase n=1 Tax=Serratia marcescens SM39 TaxID=1334564 RepID=A0AAT9E9M7_SERMA|nr:MULTISPECIES: GGDEF domain-containing protein [Serratia]ASL97742.1 sensor domain-containing diguanylate cyclase [Serratia marcescens]AVN51388.1 sensor domain-containing diguanylate cyclase [Serratia marcescens]AWC72993.1 sensor domain-containing diguanylate cyclase [Serratia marcescens]AWC77025.1 sensor domain-containing diguanylate cyclase [Serratia marcescens]AWC90971.1 sensor domain-containing diguanylate cyclase [Serratia marcescens]